MSPLRTVESQQNTLPVPHLAWPWVALRLNLRRVLHLHLHLHPHPHLHPHLQAARHATQRGSPTTKALCAAAWLTAGLASGVLAAPPAGAANGPLLAAGSSKLVLALPLGQRTRLIYEPGRVLPPNPLADVQPAAPSLGLEFKGPDANQGPRGLLRVQLSGNSAVQFRPRRSGLVVTYRAEF